MLTEEVERRRGKELIVLHEKRKKKVKNKRERGKEKAHHE